MNTRHLTVILLLVTLCAPGLVQAARSDISAPGREWTFAVAPYTWLNKYHTSIDGTDVGNPLSDLTSGTNASFMFVATAHWRKWAFAFDGVFNSLDETVTNGGISARLDISQTMLQPQVGFRLLDNRKPADHTGQALWVNLGARYWDNTTRIDWTYTPSGSNPQPVTDVLIRDNAWWDPLVGVSAHFKFDDFVHGYVRGNVGGFGMGDASDFTWDLSFIFAYRLSRTFGFHGGYQLISFKRTTGEGTTESTTDQLTEGLFVGVSVVF